MTEPTEHGSADSSKRFRRLALAGLQLVITVAILGLIATRIDLSAAFLRLTAMRGAPLLAALAVVALAWPLTAWRWGLLLRHAGAELSPREVARTQLASLLMSQAVPTVGGDAWRVMAVRRAGHAWSVGLTSIVLDRYFAVLGLTLVVALTHPLFLSRTQPGSVRTITSLGLAGALMTCGFVLVADRLFRNESSWLGRIASIGARAREVLCSRSALIVLGVSLSTQLLGALAAFLLARALGVPLALWDSLILMPPVILMAALPVSLSGWGVREGSAVALFATVGIGAEAAVSVALALGLSLLVTSLPGVYVVLTDRAADPLRR